jgi:molybdate transport system substrate-binding protein
LAKAFEAQHEDVAIILNYASSSQLAAQLIEGAVADVYASANATQMQNVIDAGQIEGGDRHIVCLQSFDHYRSDR